jgi:hypothetical protein
MIFLVINAKEQNSIYNAKLTVQIPNYLFLCKVDV